jgi:hypothetical protein
MVDWQSVARAAISRFAALPQINAQNTKNHQKRPKIKFPKPYMNITPLIAVA